MYKGVIHSQLKMRSEEKPENHGMRGRQEATNNQFK